MKTVPKPPVLTLDPNDENIILGIPDDLDPNAAEEPANTKKEKVGNTLGFHCIAILNSFCASAYIGYFEPSFSQTDLLVVRPIDLFEENWV